MKAPRTVTAGRRRGRQGFTLAEIMIALGVMGVALGMAAAAFHAGIQSHSSSVSDVLRSLISDNALAIVKARLRHARAPADLTTTLNMVPVGSLDSAYPIGLTTGRGFVCVGKQAGGSVNDYILSIMPYVLSDPTCTLYSSSSVGLLIKDAVDSQGRNVSAIEDSSGGTKLAGVTVGSAVLVPDPASGGMVSAKVSEMPTNAQAVLDRKVGRVFNALVILVSVTNAAGQPVTGVSIDFMPTCTVRTALRPA